MTAELLTQAKAGDGDAFRQLTDPYRRELQVHCYRMLGSLQDAEDALQDAMLAAWQGIDGFEERSSLRTWLYRVATNRCLNVRRAASRRPRFDEWPFPDVEPIEANDMSEVVWLEPYPDALFEYEANETMSLAFITVLQRLPPKQRAVLVLRDVLGFHADEVAETLDTTVESVTSALKRARATVATRLAPALDAPPPVPRSPEEADLVALLTRAYESGDIDALVALLTDDVLVSMPPMPLEYRGPELARRFLMALVFRDGRTYKLVPTRANGSPAFGAYLVDPSGGPSHSIGLLVFTLAGDRVSSIVRFDNALLPHFGLPRTVPG